MDQIQSSNIFCPHCGEAQEILIDTSGGDQTYIEDCSVCCHPIELTIRTAGDELVDLIVEASQ